MLCAMHEQYAEQSSVDQGARRGRKPRPMTEASLHRAALGYIDRYATSEDNLRRVLERKVARRGHGADPTPAAGWIEGIVADLAHKGLIDDAAYAAGRARALRDRGASTRAIRAALRQKGVDRHVTDIALAPYDSPDGDRSAACRYAQRRRLGPFRAAPERAARRDRDLAALARAGFDYSLALDVIDAASAEALDGQP